MLEQMMVMNMMIQMRLLMIDILMNAWILILYYYQPLYIIIYFL